MFLSLIVASAFAGNLQISELNQTIKQQNLNWTAKKTWVSELSQAELKKVLGVKGKFNQGVIQDDYMEKSNNDQLDYRNIDGINWLGPVMNQGNCGSCVAFATVATLEAQIAFSSKQAWYHPSFSTQALFGCGGGACEQGWFPSAAAQFVVDNGVTDSACLPYTSGSTGEDVECSAKCADAGKRTFKAAETFDVGGWFGSSTTKTIEALKKGPLMTTMTVYSDFTAYAGGIYKSTSNTVAGGHAISLVGYNARERYWIIRNSWGEEWGEKGFARISWDDKSGVGKSNNGFELSNEEKIVSIVSPADGAYISDLAQVKVLYKSEMNESVSTVLKNLKTGQVYPLGCTASEDNACSSQIEKGLPDGAYEAYAQMGNQKSVYQRLFVVNNAPEKLGIEILNTLSWNNLSGRVEMDVKTETSSVPFEYVEFFVLDSTGKIVAQKKQREILPKMKLGFRTTNHPNGNYEIFYKGYLPVNGQKIESESNHFKITIKN